MAPTGPTDETTLGGASAAETRRASTPAHSGWLSSSQPGDGRFASGTILADRYRIIGLLGRGGMGEVYRADDLRLGQPVALKFLPQTVTGDNVRLAQFHNEVRVARQVSHRNVCRVYDIGEADGSIFLTMEYVDGEDLASLLRRIGRFPQDRAIEIARQLCAGLAAAHEQGVLHRDLKPANVMIDREGRVRITDFGLAGLAHEIHDIRAGTPAYMAPEQLAGREVSIRSDIFALGLVLFEIFTGRRAYDAKTIAELLRMHDEGLSVTPSSAVQDLDAVVERVILRCLEREPARRPASAIAVSAALPGGDPLAAALAAGETPSPEMVANAGRRDAISPLYGLSAIAVIVVGIIGITAGAYQTLIIHRTPFDRPPAVLEDRARTHLEAFGYREPPRDTASGFNHDGDYERYVERTRRGADRWRELEAGRTPTAMFWYRTSPDRIVPSETTRRAQPNDPPFTTPGMTSVRVDTVGRLLWFQAIPPRHETAGASGQGTQGAAASGAEPDWSRAFAAAELPMARFTPVTPEWTPWGYADRRAAWTGVIPDAGDLPIRVEAAAHRGRITSFQILYPWSDRQPTDETPKTFAERSAEVIGDVVYFGLTLIALVMARRNVRLKRVDRRGAFWTAAVMFTFAMVQWVLDARQAGDTTAWQDRLFTAVAISLLQSGRLWIFYLALEPTVRRFWPAGLVSWTPSRIRRLARSAGRLARARRRGVWGDPQRHAGALPADAADPRIGPALAGRERPQLHDRRRRLRERAGARLAQWVEHRAIPRVLLCPRPSAPAPRFLREHRGGRAALGADRARVRQRRLSRLGADVHGLSVDPARHHVAGLRHAGERLHVRDEPVLRHHPADLRLPRLVRLRRPLDLRAHRGARHLRLHHLARRPTALRPKTPRRTRRSLA